MTRLEIAGVTKRYGNVETLHGLSLALTPGVTGLLGPNGAGKSTLIRILATVSRPSAGSIRFGEIDVLKTPNALRAELGYLPQDVGVYPQLSAENFLLYIAALKNIPAREARPQIARLLAQLNLEAARTRPLGAFSGGMRQRVGIAQALLGDPAVIIVDEPTVGLDPEERVRFRELIAGLGRERIVLLSTHIVSDIEQVAGRVIIMQAGTIVADGTPEHVIGAHGSLERAYLASVGSDQAA